jgi:hypothetical protein
VNASVATLALLVLVASPPLTPRPLDGAAIISAFEGKTLTGAYGDGRPFRETYDAGGAIDYWDPFGAASGQWSVKNNLFCTFYDGMDGACFRIEQIGANCFDFYAAADTLEQAETPSPKPRYTARGSATDKPSTCPEEVQV